MNHEYNMYISVTVTSDQTRVAHLYDVLTEQWAIFYLTARGTTSMVIYPLRGLDNKNKISVMFN